MERFRHMRITVLGTRGSAPVCGNDYATFGGNTSCYLVEVGGESIFLDAGTGLMGAPGSFERDPVILLSHLHADHLLGLGMYARISFPGATTKLFVPADDAQDARAAVERLYSPPLWPLRLGDYKGNLQIDALPRKMRIGDVTVETEQGSHPGTCLLIKIRYAQKSLVYATDFEHGEEASLRLAEFSRNADLLLYDGQYSEEQYESHRSFGHSTPGEGVALMKRCGAKRMLIVHHDPFSTDSALIARERSLDHPHIRFAREGETIEL